MLSIIQEYNNHLEEIFENSFDYIYLHDKEGNILDVNNIVVKNLGYSKNEILRMRVTDFLFEETISKVSEEIRETIETGVVNKPKTYKVKKKDGSFVYIEASAIPLKENGEFYAILGIGHDVTPYIKVVKKLKESEKKFRHLFDQSPYSILIFDYKGNLINSNRKLVKKLGDFVGIEFSGKNFIEIISYFENSEQLLQIFKERFKALREGKDLQTTEFPVITKSGQKLWLFWQSSKVQIENETLIQVIINDITEMKNAEEELKVSEKKFRNLSHKLEERVNERTKELKQSEEKYRELFNGMSNGVVVYETPDEGTTFIFKDMNPSGEKISGVKREDILGKDVLELFPRIKPAGLFDTFKKVYKIDTPVRHPITFYGDETISRWAENYVYKLPTGEIVAVYDDLTELKITEQKLRLLNEELEQRVGDRTKELKESEEKFRTMTEQSLVGIVILQDDVFKYANQRVANIIGYTIEEIQNWGPREFVNVIHPEYQQVALEQARKKQNGSKDVVTRYIIKCIRKTGENVWVEIFSRTISYQGRLADFITFIDITDNKQAEQRLVESEEKFRNIAEQSFMGIIIIQNGELKYMNKALSKISGYSIDEMLNWSQKDMLKIIHPDDLETILKRLQSNIEGTMGSFSSNVFRIISKNGDLRWLEDHTTRIVYQGKLANLISIVDITERKEVEQLIIEENKRLLELHELRKDLITRVSHELKTPMTSIYGASQILTKLYMNEIGEEPQKYIEIGHRGCLRLKQLINNLLDVSRLDAKRFELKLQREDLVELLIDCVKDMNYLATDRQLKMKIELPDEFFLDIDRLRFRQVLTNIISNAIKNTPIEGEIFIDLVEKSDCVDIRVKDTGIGLTEKEKENSLLMAIKVILETIQKNEKS